METNQLNRDASNLLTFTKSAYDEISDESEKYSFEYSSVLKGTVM